MPQKTPAQLGFVAYITYAGVPLEYFTAFKTATQTAEDLSKECPGAYIAVQSTSTHFEICAWLNGRYIPNN